MEKIEGSGASSSAEEGEVAGELASPSDMAQLQARINKIQENGLATPAQKLFELATEKSPSALMMDFMSNASPEVTKAMQDYVASLFGSLPSIGASAQTT